MIDNENYNNYLRSYTEGGYSLEGTLCLKHKKNLCQYKLNDNGRSDLLGNDISLLSSFLVYLVFFLGPFSESFELFSINLRLLLSLML